MRSDSNDILPVFSKRLRLPNDTPERSAISACVRLSFFRSFLCLSAIDTQISKKNKIKIGDYTLKKVHLILLDLTHINNALTKQNAKPVNGIIGADILEKGKAIIDYNKKKLYLLK